VKISVDQYPYLDSVDLFAKVAEQEWAILLDSGAINGQTSVGGDSGFDVLAIKPETTLVTIGRQTTITSSAGSETMTGNPLQILRRSLPEIEDSDTKLAYLPGAIGYFAYDLARQFETLPTTAKDDEQLPEMAMGIYPAIVLVDHKARTTSLVSINLSRHSKSRVTEWRDLIESALDESNQEMPFERLESASLQQNLDREDYQLRFDKVRQYTVDGDCYQVNLAKRFSTRVMGSAWLTYCHLRTLSPAPYGAYMSFPFAQVLSNSPESFVQCRSNRVKTSPIKGTRPRNHQNKQADKDSATELYYSAKDRAENVMIVDLMRNDLSKCCELGSVDVPELFAVHSFANVHHLISTITGTLKQGLHSLDLLQSCFPGGSITGAPKIRAMQIIEELEPHRRGLYCGAIGYVGVDGSLETNIAIRTIVIKDQVARFSAGGGLVVDSNADEEYQEIIDKARMMTAALLGNARL